MDPTPNIPSSKTVEELGITVSVSNTDIWNQRTIFKEPVSKQLSQRKMKTVEYKEADMVLLKWFWDKSGVCGHMNQKAAAAQNDTIILHVMSTWVVNTTPQPLYLPERDPVSIIQEVGWALGPVWMGTEYLTTNDIQSLACPICSKSLLSLCCSDCPSTHSKTYLMLMSVANRVTKYASLQNKHLERRNFAKPND
jgi:hypothetical protein